LFIPYVQLLFFSKTHIIFSFLVSSPLPVLFSSVLFSSCESLINRAVPFPLAGGGGMCKICFHKKQISYVKIYEIFFNTKNFLKKIFDFNIFIKRGMILQGEI
jgi:hypothetical protein